LQGAQRLPAGRRGHQPAALHRHGAPGPGGPELTLLSGRGRALLAAVILAVVAAAAVFGLTRLEVDTAIGSLLPAHDRAVTHWEETQAAFGADPVVVLLETDTAGALLIPDAVKRLVALESTLAGLPNVAVVYGPGTTPKPKRPDGRRWPPTSSATAPLSPPGCRSASRRCRTPPSTARCSSTGRVGPSPSC